MHQLDGRPVYSASDLVGFLACEHLTDLERAALAGLVARPQRDDPQLDLIRRRGYRHEQRFRDDLIAQGRDVFEVAPDASGDGPEGSREGSAERLRRQVEATIAAMREGRDVIYQAAFFDGTWRGHADFLLRVDGPDAASALGGYHYEIADTKLAHQAKAGALIQLCTYADLLTPLQGRAPAKLHVALGGPERRIETYRLADCVAYYRALKERFERATADEAEGGRPVAYPPSASEPDPVDHCDVCRWFLACRATWRATDHLSLVAGISRNQRRALVEREVPTRRALAVLPLPVEPPLARTSREAVERVREQARIQVEGEDQRRVLHELLAPEVVEGVVVSRGLAALPEPSPGDLFFDIEGDPFAFDDGLEYLFGVVEPGRIDQAGGPTYHDRWALGPEQEKQAFEWFIDLVMDRRRRDPGLHVYHYGSYERGRVARLSTRHGTREEEVDELLRAGVFVDLFNAVRQGIRASVEGYSIKNLEPLYGFARSVELRMANESIVEFERYLEEGGSDRAILDRIADYNRDDCLSAWGLRDWLEARRPEAELEFGVTLHRPVGGDGAPSEDASAARLEVRLLAERLTAGLPPPEERSADDHDAHALQLLADLLDWHWREEKSGWWRFFDLMARPDEELEQEREPVAGLEFESVTPPQPRQKNARYRYRFPPQENELKPGVGVHDPRLLGGERSTQVGTVEDIDQIGGSLVLSRPPGVTNHPTALVPLDSYRTHAQRRALLEMGAWVADNGLRAAGPFRAGRDLLLRLAPRVGPHGGDLALATENGEQAALRLVRLLDHTTLPIQGPPGSGKTTTGADMIVSLLDAGLRVGITATSHKVITNLLRTVVARAGERGVPVRAVQKAGSSEQAHDSPQVELVDDNGKVRQALDEGANVAAGTPWLWAAREMREGTEAVDVLFVDEAGQMSLANALAVSVGARSMVLLGDPQQLEQPSQGVHPGDAGRSALEHVLGGRQTIESTRGLFLEHTWRLHPQICRFTSELFYEGLLEPRPGLERQEVHADGQPLAGSGLRFVTIEHDGNTSRSVEEAGLSAALARALVDGRAEWTDWRGRRQPLTWEDVLIVAPYNAQVREIRDRLPQAGKLRVGTVDKFQGQQAAVAIYSMTTSSPGDAPHGMEFLYSLNRLNVATSRARCLAVVVGNPALLRASCRTPRQVRLANALCRFVELAAPVATTSLSGSAPPTGVASPVVAR